MSSQRSSTTSANIEQKSKDLYWTFFEKSADFGPHHLKVTISRDTIKSTFGRVSWKIPFIIMCFYRIELSTLPSCFCCHYTAFWRHIVSSTICTSEIDIFKKLNEKHMQSTYSRRRPRLYYSKATWVLRSKAADWGGYYDLRVSWKKYSTTTTRRRRHQTHFFFCQNLK